MFDRKRRTELIARLLAGAVALGMAVVGQADGTPDCPGQISGQTTAWLTPSLVGQNSACNYGTISGDLVASMNFFSASPDPTVIDPSVCGRCLRVTGPDGSVVVRVVDVNNSSTEADGDLNLNEPAYDAVFAGTPGTVGVQWESVECPVAGFVTVAHRSFSSEFQLFVVVDNHSTGLDSVSVDLAGGPASMTRSSFNVFSTEVVAAGTGPHEFTLADVHGPVDKDDGDRPRSRRAGAGWRRPVPPVWRTVRRRLRVGEHERVEQHGAVIDRDSRTVSRSASRSAGRSFIRASLLE